MSRKFYLISPAPDAPSYTDIEAMREITGRPTAHIVALALPTVAAMVPDDFEIILCDECVTPIDFDSGADYIGLTAMVSNWRRASEIAGKFRRRGKTVIIGGPHASLRPEVVRPCCDILVRGELENIADELFADLRSGEWKPEYIGTAIDLSHSPKPRLDLYPNDRALSGALQISRGCPFQCEFCDVIQYQGRKQRHKTIPQVIAELEQLRDVGYGYVFLVDDNLTAHRKRAKALLRVIRDWNDRQVKKITFATQVSIEAAGDDELLRLLAEAGIVEVFVGIETPNAESLEDVKKQQNNKYNLTEHIERFVKAGIAVIGGMIVGFDADRSDIFEKQFEFAMSLPVPIFTANVLYAPESTPLYARLKREGRIHDNDSDRPLTLCGTNIVPKHMTREELQDGLMWLCNKLYSPRAFEKRLRRVAGMIGKRPDRQKTGAVPGRTVLRPVDHEYSALLRKLPRLGLAEAAMALRFLLYVFRHPRAAGIVIRYLAFYVQVRHMYNRERFWHPELARQENPAIEATELALAS